MNILRSLLFFLSDRARRNRPAPVVIAPGLDVSGLHRPAWWRRVRNESTRASTAQKATSST